MNQKEWFLKVWEKEAVTTQKVISRVPQNRCEYRADPKARTARELAWLIASEDASLVNGLEKGAFEWIEQPPPGTMAEIVEMYERSRKGFTERLRALEVSRWEAQVPFLLDGKEVMSASGYESAWGFLLDQIHHRGQLSTYLRPMGSTVPQIYGPSADEPM